jgi:hypothetical protein
MEPKESLMSGEVLQLLPTGAAHVAGLSTPHSHLLVGATRQQTMLESTNGKVPIVLADRFSYAHGEKDRATSLVECIAHYGVTNLLVFPKGDCCEKLADNKDASQLTSGLEPSVLQLSYFK